MITRRIFIKHFTALTVLFASAIELKAKDSAPKTKQTTLKVAGLQYGEASNYLFTSDEPLKLQREPDNPYDRYAVALYVGKKKVGYIPKTNSRIVASLIDSGVVLRASVRYFHSEKEPWERLWVSVWKFG